MAKEIFILCISMLPMLTALSAIIKVPRRCVYCEQECCRVPLMMFVFDPGRRCHMTCFWKAHPIPPRPRNPWEAPMNAEKPGTTPAGG